MKAAIWSMLQQFGRHGLLALFLVVVSNYISPGELGLFGIASICTAFMTLFLDPGFAQALIQRKELEQRHYSSVLAVNVGAGIALALLGFALSRPVSTLLGEPAAAPLIAVLSLGFIPSSLISMQTAMAQRELRFKSLALRDLAASSLSAVCGIGAVLYGLGVWSIVVQSLVFNITAAAVLWNVSPVRVAFRTVSVAALRDLWPFGSQMLRYAVFKYFTRNLDSWLVVSIFGPETLGLYIFAQRFIFDPIRVLQAGLGAYLFPKASRVQENPARLKQLYLLSYKLLNYSLLAYGICAVVFGKYLVPAIFGEQWTDAVEIVALMAIILLVHPACVPIGEVLKATHRPHWLFWWAVFLTVLTNGSLVAAAPLGFEAAILAFALAFLLAMPVVVWMIHETVALSLREFRSRMLTSYLLLGALAVVLLGIDHVLSDTILLDLAAGAVACAVFAGLIYVVDEDMKSFADTILRTVIPKIWTSNA